MDDREYRKSSFSNRDRHCVMISMDENAVFVKDSKDMRLEGLRFTKAEWVAFVEGVKAGEFDTE